MPYALIKESESSLRTVSHGVPQGFVLEPLLFILFINGMHNSVGYCKVHHYMDDTNLLLTDNSLKKINRQVNHDPSLEKENKSTARQKSLFSDQKINK